jgi:YVTN family beta-propeller protein
MKFKLSILLLVLAAFSSCKKDTPADTTEAIPFEADLNNGVYVINEGVFTNGDASISYYNGSGSASIKDVYQAANSTLLGDVGQSICRIGDTLFIIVNNSSKIEVVNAKTMKNIGTIPNMGSPRYMLPVSTTKAYVTDLYSNSIHVLSTTTNGVVSEIPLNGSTEQLLMYDGFVYVTNMSRPYLYKIDPINDIVVDSIMIGAGGNSICLDKNNKLWILCGGDYFTSTTSSIFRIDPATFSQEILYLFPPDVYLNRMTINASKDVLYYLNTNVYKMSIDDLNLPTTEFINANGKNFYSIGFNNSSNTLYVGDAVDFQQAGRVYMFAENGTDRGNFGTGTNPGNFLFLGN